MARREGLLKGEDGSGERRTPGLEPGAQKPPGASGERR